jgi:hypothetical protein
VRVYTSVKISNLKHFDDTDVFILGVLDLRLGQMSRSDHKLQRVMLNARLVPLTRIAYCIVHTLCLLTL